MGQRRMSLAQVSQPPSLQKTQKLGHRFTGPSKATCVRHTCHPPHGAVSRLRVKMHMEVEEDRVGLVPMERVKGSQWEYQT